MKKMIVCNQKMLLTRDIAKNVGVLMNDIDFSNVDLIVCPSFINFDIFKNFTLCAQDCFYEKNGPYTAEISAYDLFSLGIKYSLVGHSYRRRYDSNEIINLKTKAIIENSMLPIICVGETREEKSFGDTIGIIEKQIKSALKGVAKVSNIIIAYEPIWAIGSGISLNKDEINYVIKNIKTILYELGFNNYKILYGGSVTSLNIKEISQSDADGYLLGNSSVDIDELKKIIYYTEKRKQ